MIRLLTLVFLLISAVANADEDTLGLEFFGSFVHSSEVPNSLFLFSDIEPNDSFELRRALRTHDIDTVVLASSGGSVWEALTMAGIIHDKKLQTFVPKLPDEMGCYSACAFMYFAGTTRVADGSLGVHQIGAYDTEADKQKIELGQTQQLTQFTTSEVIGFLNEFETPPWVFERMFRSREIYLFNDLEKSKLSTGEMEPAVKAQISKFIEALIREVSTERTEQRETSKEKQNRPKEIDLKDISLVKAIQTALSSKRCSVGSIDGIWGRQTNYAASRFAAANKLPYSGPTSINSKFIETLTLDDSVICAPIPKPRTLAGAWNFEWSCKNQGSFSGKAKISKNGRLYNVTFTNQFGGRYSGSISTEGRRFSFYATQLNGDDVSKGSGQIASNWRRVYGTTQASCRYEGIKVN